MSAEELKVWLLVSLAFVLTQPGVVLLFASPGYGIVGEIPSHPLPGEGLHHSVSAVASMWLSTISAGILMVLIYGILLWRDGRIGRNHVIGLLFAVIITDLLACKLSVGGCSPLEVGFWLILGVILFFFSIVLLPIVVVPAFSGTLYPPYARPLEEAWIASIAVLFILLIAYLRKRKEEKFREGDTPTP